MSEELLSVPRLAVDTAPLVYFLVGAPRRANLVRQVLARAAQGDLELVVSAVTEAELLVAPSRQEDPEAACRPVHDLLAGPPAFDVRDVSRPIARRAASIRAAWNLRLADAIIAATAVEAGCPGLLGNGGRFRRLEVEGLTYYHLDDLVPPPG